MKRCEDGLQVILLTCHDEWHPASHKRQLILRVVAFERIRLSKYKPQCSCQNEFATVNSKQWNSDNLPRVTFAVAMR